MFFQRCLSSHQKNFGLNFSFNVHRTVIRSWVPSHPKSTEKLLCTFSLCSKYKQHRPFSLLSVYSNGCLRKGSLKLYSTRELQTGQKNESHKDVNEDDEELKNYVVPQFSDFKGLAHDVETEKKIHLILMEYEVGHQSGYLVPKEISEKDMYELLHLQSYSARREYFKHLCKIEWKRLADKKKRELKKIRREEEWKKIESTEHMHYGLHKNCIFMRILPSSMHTFYNYRLAYSVMFGQKMVIDFDYDQFMERREMLNTAFQLQVAYAENRISGDPYNLYICNAKSDSPTLQYLKSFMPNLDCPNCFINVKNESYLDLFPKDKIVYLSPHSPNVLEEYDHDAVYIIGGFVDKSDHKPRSLAKIKREGIKSARLPLDNYLLWGPGSGKNLTVNHTLQVMLEMKNTGEWNKALQFVPRRKIISTEELRDRAESRLSSSVSRKKKMLHHIDFIYDKNPTKLSN